MLQLEDYYQFIVYIFHQMLYFFCYLNQKELNVCHTILDMVNLLLVFYTEKHLALLLQT